MEIDGLAVEITYRREAIRLMGGVFLFRAFFISCLDD